jgi:hypothetical protein
MGAQQGRFSGRRGPNQRDAASLFFMARRKPGLASAVVIQGRRMVVGLWGWKNLEAK